MTPTFDQRGWSPTDLHRFLLLLSDITLAAILKQKSIDKLIPIETDAEVSLHFSSSWMKNIYMTTSDLLKTRGLEPGSLQPRPPLLTLRLI